MYEINDFTENQDEFVDHAEMLPPMSKKINMVCISYI